MPIDFGLKMNKMGKDFHYLILDKILCKEEEKKEFESNIQDQEK